MTVVTPTDRPKSVRYRCVINLLSELFVSLLCFMAILLEFGLCHLIWSDLFIFSSTLRLLDFCVTDLSRLEDILLILRGFRSTG